MAGENAGKNIVNQVVFAATKETLRYFMDNKAVKYAFVKTLLDAKMTTEQIRKIVKISPQTVSEIRNQDPQEVDRNLVETLRGMEINKLNLVGAKMLNVLDDEVKLKAMKGGELAYAYKVLLDARRLLENKSTANISVQVSALNQRFDEDAKKITNLLTKAIDLGASNAAS